MNALRDRARDAVALAAAGATLLTHAPARAQVKEQCIEAFEHGQDQRDHLKLRAARDSYVACARDACPAPLRKDCAEALEEVTRDLPTVTIGARDADGHDLVAVRVLVDDEPIALDESGRSLPIDPGQHTVRFEYPSYVSVSQRILVRMGERNRAIVATLRHPQAQAPLAAPPPPLPDKDDSGPSPWVVALTGVGLVALGSFTFFAITGKNEKDRLASACAPSCTDQDVSGLKSRYIAADVSLLVGVAALGVAATLFFATSHPARARAAQ